MSFLARSTLPANLKLAAVFACVMELDFDLRLAYGMLADQLEPYYMESPTECPAQNGPCINIPSDNLWLIGYVHGCLSQVNGNLGGNSKEREEWLPRFWNEFLVMSCRWADSDGVRLAIDNGAQMQYNDYQAVEAAAEGVEAYYNGSAYYACGLSNTNYREILDLLFSLGADLAQAAASGLKGAAATGNRDLLEFLVERGADIHAGDDAALIAAAANAQIAIVALLLKQGANVHAADGMALVAAIGALSCECVVLLLKAGADLHAVEALALRTAFGAMPYDLCAGHCQDFVSARSEMIVLLLNLGVDAGCVIRDLSIRDAPYIRELVSHLLASNKVAPEAKVHIRSLAPSK